MDGNLGGIVTSSQSTRIMQVLTKVLVELSKLPSAMITPDADLIRDIGLDSLQLTELFLRLEEELNIRIDFAQLEPEHYASLTALIEFLQSSSGASSA